MPGRTETGVLMEFTGRESENSSKRGERHSFAESSFCSSFGDGEMSEFSDAPSIVTSWDAPAMEAQNSVKMAKGSASAISRASDAISPSNGIKMFIFPKTDPPIDESVRSDATGEDDESITEEGTLEVSIVHRRTSAHLRHMMHFIVELLRPPTAKVAPKRAKVVPKRAKVAPKRGKVAPKTDRASRASSVRSDITRRPLSPAARTLKRTPSTPLPSSSSGASNDVGFGDNLRSPGRGEDIAEGSDEETAEDTTSDSNSPQTQAVARPEVEGDVETGDAPAAGAEVDARAGVTTAATAAVSRPAVVSTEPGDISLILPCPPTDHEKALYHKSGRALLVTTGLVAFYVMSVGMWLFTVTSPYFFWFGVPTVFLMFYLICHYLLVALWGIDFNPEAHAEILSEAEEQSFWPAVDVFLPVCKEPLFLLENTWKYVAELDYPNFTVHVLDDGAENDVRCLAAQFGFRYVRRPDRPHLKKAGNLRYSFARTHGDFLAIFDADFCPRRDYLRETIPYFVDQSIGILQTPQFFRWRKEQSWIEQGAGVTQEFFYRMVQVNQDRFNAAVCCGSCGLYRRAALEPFGGMVAIAHSEDMYTGYKITTEGYKIKYLPLNLAMGICPDEPQSFFMQQYRWCMGSATLVAEKEFWTSNISVLHKVCFMNGMLYYVASALLLFMAPVPILLLIALEADGVLWYHSAFVVPCIILAAVIIPCWAKQRYDLSSHRVKIIQCYAHLFAIYDRLCGRSAPWVPSGGGASKASSKAYRSSVWVLIIWNFIITFLIVGGSVWRMTYLTWYHFIPAIVIAMGSFVLNMSTLWY